MGEYKLQNSKTTLIYNGVAEPIVDENRLAQLAEQFALRGNHDQIIVGTVARLTVAKGLEYLIMAMARLVDRYPQLKLIIAGDGELKESLQQLTNDLGLSEKVIFAGYLEDVHNLIYFFDIFVLASLQEALPLASAEAMSMGKPMIGTAVGGIPEQVIDGETGFIVLPQDVSALVESIDRLISNPAMLEDFGRQAYARYQEKFALATMLSHTVAVYEKVMNS